ncbi:hypothetical protein ACTOB_005764 [Actinoplanes oblitus]|uniref:Secreted protein n=1 Tax=Actinoplanes oblitus TaxID=3040509 RepID=A0ABY8WBE2_9ACTN|nr:hypothetical protein [Actinoplanes oblitus]WIM93778.1 hypothetical protein ACTOB_005764 [Actinoplanes oblitus]
MTFSRRLAAAGGVATVLVFGLAAPALAHDVRLGGPNGCGATKLQSCGYVQVRSNHTIVDACDTKQDGTGYAATYKLKNGTTGMVSDGNGAASGCGIIQAGTSSNPVTQLAGCYYFGGAWLCNPLTAV